MTCHSSRRRPAASRPARTRAATRRPHAHRADRLPGAAADSGRWPGPASAVHHAHADDAHDDDDHDRRRPTTNSPPTTTTVAATSCAEAARASAHDDDRARAPAGHDSRASTGASAVNVAPSFTAGGSQTVIEDAGAQAVHGGRPASRRGRALRARRSLLSSCRRTTRACSRPGRPSRPDGTLTYTPAPDANGVAHVNVTAVDDGGTANGGHDTSATQALTVTVKPVNDAPSFQPGATRQSSRCSGPEP